MWVSQYGVNNQRGHELREKPDNPIVFQSFTLSGNNIGTQEMKSEHFDNFWQAYPRKENGKKARAVWDRDKLDEKGKLIIADVERRKKSEKWQNRKYIPLPTTYLNGERWNDEHESLPDNNKSKAKNFICAEPGCNKTAVHRQAPFLCAWHLSVKHGNMKALNDFHEKNRCGQYPDETRDEWQARLREMRKEYGIRFRQKIRS